MVEIQLHSLENFPAILAGILVSFEDVMPGELYLLLGQPIEKKEDNHAWHADLPRNRCDHLVLGLGRGQRDIEPAREIMRREIVFVISCDNLGMALVKQGESTTRRADIDRLPKTIQHQNLTV